MEMKAIWPGWEVVRKIGSGSFGNVYEIERDMFGEKEKAAMKVISIPHNPDEVDDYRSQGYTDADITQHYHQCLQQIIQEYSLMAKIKGHSNVVSCEDVQYIPKEDGIGWNIYIKMELLSPLMKNLDQVANEEQIVRLGADICNALVLCKERNIIHRDIKPQNIFVSDTGSYKLGDFGIAKTVERTSGGTRVGTYKYMAPEVYNNHPYGTAADIYSLGLVLYWLLNDKRTPFLPMPPQMPTAAMEEEAGLRRFRGEAIPEPKYGSSELKRIVLKACAYASVDRYATAAEMLQDLRGLQNISAVPFPAMMPAGPIGGMAGSSKPMASAGTVLLEDMNNEGTMVLDQQGTMVLENAEPYVPQVQSEKPAPAPQQPEKKKKGVLWVILGAAVVGVIILLLLLQSCDGRPDAGGQDQNGTTAPTTAASTTAPTTGSTTAPTTSTAPDATTEIEKIVTVMLDMGYTSTAADGRVSYTSYGVNLTGQEMDSNVGFQADAPTRPGYTFDGWYTAETGGEKLSSGAAVSDGATYYARWTGNKVNVTYDADGGTFSNGKNTVVIATQNGTNFVLPAEIPTKAGYNFMGWTDGESMVTENRIKGYVYEQTFKAMWGENEYAYNVECVAKYEDGTQKTVKIYSVINKLDGTYTITPEAITGYQAPAAQTVKWDSTTPKTITFIYTPNKITGTVIFQYGKNTEQSQVTYEYNSDPKIQAKEIRGYTPAAQYQVINGWGVNGSPTVTFAYTGNRYYISFNANGGSGNMSKQTCYYGEVFYLTANKYTREGYTFQGWVRNPSDSSEVPITSKDGLFNLTSEKDATVVLYAVWKPVIYIVNFDDNGGHASSLSTPVTYGSAYGRLPTATRDYYNFVGWFTAKTGGTQVTATTLVTATSNHTLYARWEAKETKWVLADQLPANATIVDEYWTYTKTETTTSTATSMSGWTQTGYTWQETGSGVYYYTPKRKSNDVFNTQDPLYTKYNVNGSAKTNTETDTTKRVYSGSAVYTYIYWHWTANTTNNAMSNIQNEVLTQDNNKKASLWEAVEYTEKPTKKDGDGFLDSETGIRHYAYEKNFGSKYHSIYWWYNTVYKQTYTDYQKLFTYQKVTKNVRSETAVTAGGEISDVQHWVLCREK